MEVPQRFLKLQTTPAYIGTNRTANFQLYRFIIGHAGLIRLLAVHIHLAAHDDRLGLRTGICIPLLRQQNIQSLLNFHSPEPPVRMRQ